MTMVSPTIHATALLLGAEGVLIRGPSASGKTTLAQTLIGTWRKDGFACLVADDQVVLNAMNGRLVASPPPAIAGRFELRGRGILTTEYEPYCVLRLVIDIVDHDDFERMPANDILFESLLGVTLKRQPVPTQSAIATLLIESAFARA